MELGRGGIPFNYRKKISSTDVGKAIGIRSKVEVWTQVSWERP